MRAAKLGHLVKLPMGPRNAVLGVPKQRHAESKGQGGRRGEGEREGGSGREETRSDVSFFKTRTQHHRMVGNYFPLFLGGVIKDL